MCKCLKNFRNINLLLSECNRVLKILSSTFQLKHCYIFGIHFYSKSKKKKKNLIKIASNFNVFQQIFGIANNKIMATYMKKKQYKR